MNEDLRRARLLMEQGDYTCVLCRGTEIKTCTARGVRPLVELLDAGQWTGFSAADKVIGKATAFLYVLLGVRAVYTPAISQAAVQVLEENRIRFVCDRIVPAIFNRDRTGFCPMETAVRDIRNPREALPAIRATMAKLRLLESVSLRPFSGERDTAVQLIRQFWLAHNGQMPTEEDAGQDLSRWTAPGHRLFLIRCGEEAVGFVHLGSRGCKIDWLEDIFVLPQYQIRGIGSRAITLAERIVREYSESMYIEAAARNEGAIRLYRKLGYSCLNTITVRKDFSPKDQEVCRTEQLYGEEFQIRVKRHL